MKMIKSLLITLSLILTFSSAELYSQEGQDTTLSAEDTVRISEDTTQVSEQDPVKAEISRIIKEVNNRSAEVDNIISDGEIKIKTPKVDETGSIEIHVKKKDDVWFKIEGPLGIDAATGHFNRDRFTFFDDLNDVVTTGSTTILNIGTLTKIRCTFDDMLNSFSGTVRIPKGKKDILEMSEEGSQYVISLKRGTITRRYWVDKDNYFVYKYLYMNNKGQTLISFEFSNFSNYGTATYAKKVEIRRPKQGEYFKITMETVNLNQSYLDFKVDYPYGEVKMRTWK
jgi:outer membrane lipoprotein-sorting protein